MKKLSLYVFLVLMFSLFTSHSFAATKHKIYKKLPCKFNGVKVGASAYPYEDRKVRKNRCNKGGYSYKGKMAHLYMLQLINIVLALVCGVPVNVAYLWWQLPT